MPIARSLPRVLSISLLGLSVAAAAAGCSSGPSEPNGPYMVWDPYSQFGNGSVWVKSLDKCANAAGASIKRTVVNSAGVVEKASGAEQQGLAPDLLIVDSTDIPALVSDRVLAPVSRTHLSVAGVAPDVLRAGDVGGNNYGVPVGTPVPAAGEFITIPVQTGTSRYAIDDKIVSCLTDTANAAAIDNALSHTSAAGAPQRPQVSTKVALGPIVAAARSPRAAV
jgi:hypothetical protein